MQEEERAARKSATDLLLGRGVQFDLPVPPWAKYLMPKRLRRLKIRHLKAGTILEIERLALKHKLYDEPLTPQVRVLAEVIAVAILNDRLLIPLFRRVFTEWLLWGISSDSLLELFAITRELCQLEGFTAITIWTIITMPMTRVRMGREEEGS